MENCRTEYAIFRTVDSFVFIPLVFRNISILFDSRHFKLKKVGKISKLDD